MAYETLRKYLFEDRKDARHVLTVLLDGIASTALRDNVEEYNRFVAGLDRIAEDAARNSSPDQLAVAAGAAVQALDGYNQRAARVLNRRTAELQKVIAMLTETVATIAMSSERSVQSLEEIKNNLLHANELQDLCKIKDRLGVCLDQVRQESARHREDTQKTIQQLETCICRAETHATSDVSADPVTKLPGLEAAQAMIKRLATETGRKYVTVMVFDRIQSVNARFGYEAGNQILAALARYVETKLQPTDTLFRWSGPTLVAVMQRQVTIDRIRDDLRPVFSNPVETTVDIGSRNVMIPTSPAWAVFGLLPSVETTLKAVDAFVASQVPKEYV